MPTSGFQSKARTASNSVQPLRRHHSTVQTVAHSRQQRETWRPASALGLCCLLQSVAPGRRIPHSAHGCCCRPLPCNADKAPRRETGNDLCPSHGTPGGLARVQKPAQQGSTAGHIKRAFPQQDLKHSLVQGVQLVDGSGEQAGLHKAGAAPGQQPQQHDIRPRQLIQQVLHNHPRPAGRAFCP